MYDFIIVGAGAAGLTVAESVSRHRQSSVAMIEAGSRDFPLRPSTAFNITVGNGEWRHCIDLSNGREVLYPAGKGVGGSGRINASLALRPVPDDFDAWQEAAGELWSWQEVLDDFRDLENDLNFPEAPFHGADGPIPICRWNDSQLVNVQRGFSNSCRNMGFVACDDHNAPDRYGIGPWPMNRVGSARQSPSEVFGRELSSRSNFDVMLGVSVTKVITRDGKALGVELSSGDKVYARQVILSAGTWSTPTILSSSGVGPAGREIDNPIVGQCLIDHPRVDIAGALSPSVVPDLKGPRFQSLLRHTVVDPGDVQIYPASYYSRAKRQVLRQPNSDRVYFGGLTVVETRPTSTGTVYTGERSPRPGEPVAELPLLDRLDDLELMREAVRLAWKILTSRDMSRYFCALDLTDEQVASDATLDEFLYSQVHCAYHAVGSCRMGRDESSSVVSPMCDVYGIDNLHVIDASVFPVLPRANTCLTAMMVARRVTRLHGWTTDA